MEKLDKLRNLRPSTLKVALACTLFVLLTVCLSCTGAPAGDKSVEEIPADGKIASIIRNPVTAKEPVDTVNVAKMRFEETDHDFGTIREGAVVEHRFAFTNVGKVPLLIANVRSSCGCTAPEWPKAPIAPGERGTIQVRFNSSGKYEKQQKPVIITANTFPPETNLSIQAYVERKAEEN